MKQQALAAAVDQGVGFEQYRRPTKRDMYDKARDPEMHQTRKGQQWYFGMHIAVDSYTRLERSVVLTAANAHHKHSLPDLLRSSESSKLNRAEDWLRPRRVARMGQACRS